MKKYLVLCLLIAGCHNVSMDPALHQRTTDALDQMAPLHAQMGLVVDGNDVSVADPNAAMACAALGITAMQDIDDNAEMKGYYIPTWKAMMVAVGRLWALSDDPNAAGLCCDATKGDIEAVLKSSEVKP